MDLDKLLAEFDKAASAKRRYLDAVLVVARQRLISGQREFGDRWQGRDNLAEAIEEEADLFNYRLFAKLQGREDAEGSPASE